MEIFGWLLWGLTCLFLTFFVRNIFRMKYIRMRIRSIVISTIISIGLYVTLTHNISKLHLLWYIPLSYLVFSMLEETISNTFWKDESIGTFDYSCRRCKHLHENELTCDAFPQYIPPEIWDGHFDHRNAHPDDNGIRFESKDSQKLTVG